MLVGPGSTLASRYRLVRLLGRGGMAEVYEANDGRLGRRVAVKVFRGETDIATSQARQQLEIRALARLQHPNIVGVFDAGTDAGVSFVVMQLIDGVTLAERTRGSALAPAETARVGRAVADALAHVHSFGMVHRDIKPGNILCGVNGIVFLTDFGIVRLIGRTRLTQHGTHRHCLLSGARTGTRGRCRDRGGYLCSRVGAARVPDGGAGIPWVVSRVRGCPVVPATTRPADRAAELGRPAHGYDGR